jgi:hypothetical protein
MAKKNKMSNSQKRSIRIQQIFFSVLAILIILSMIISMVSFY